MNPWLQSSGAQLGNVSQGLPDRRQALPLFQCTPRQRQRPVQEVQCMRAAAVVT
jgi:hypothetical protein